MKTLILLFLTTLPPQAETISWVVQGQMKGWQTYFEDGEPRHKETSLKGPLRLVYDTELGTGVVQSGGFPDQVKVHVQHDLITLILNNESGIAGDGRTVQVWMIHQNVPLGKGVLITGTSSRNSPIGVSTWTVSGTAIRE